MGNILHMLVLSVLIHVSLTVALRLLIEEIILHLIIYCFMNLSDS